MIMCASGQNLQNSLGMFGDSATGSSTSWRSTQSSGLPPARRWSPSGSRTISYFYFFGCCFYFYLKLQVRFGQTSSCAHVFFRSSAFSQAEIDGFFQTNNVEHLALIFEDLRSYVGREVSCFLHLKLPTFWFCSIASLLVSGITRFCPPCCPSGHFGPAAVREHRSQESLERSGRAGNQTGSD